MFEKIPENNKETKEEQEKRGEEELEYYLANHPELTEEVEKVKYNEKHAEEMEKLFSKFETDSSLEELNSIRTKEEALESTLRNEAKEALVLIHSFIKRLNKEVDVPQEIGSEIEERRHRLSMAVGFINSGLVRHE